MFKKSIKGTAIPDHLIKKCKVLPNRYHLLQHLPKNGKGIEIGVLGGDWAELLLKHTDPEELVLSDTFNSNDYPHEKRFTKKNHEAYIKTKFSALGEKIKVMKGLSWDTLSTFPDNHFDWVYVDAAHDYESVKKDLEQSYRCLKNDGYIVMNDYIMFDHFTKENYGVVQATNEFMIENDFEMLFFALHPDMFCDVLIRKTQ